MKYPYSKYAAYLVAIESNLEDFLSPFPVPKTGDLTVEYKIPRRYNNAWIDSMGLRPLASQSDIAVIAYTLWRNPQYRSLMIIAKLRKIEDVSKYISARLNFEVTEEATDFFYDVFLNFDGWTIADISGYAECLEVESDIADEEIIDSTIITLCLSNADITYIVAKAGVVHNHVDHTSILNEVFVESYKMFKEAALPDEKIKAGSFLLKTHREITTAKTDSSAEFQEELAKYKLTIKRLKYNHNVTVKPRTKEEYEQMSIFQQDQTMGVNINDEPGKE